MKSASKWPHTVSRRAPRRSPKVISTMVASGSESRSIMTLGVGIVSVSPLLPSCLQFHNHVQQPKRERKH